MHAQSKGVRLLIHVLWSEQVGHVVRDVELIAWYHSFRRNRGNGEWRTLSDDNRTNTFANNGSIVGGEELEEVIPEGLAGTWLD